VYVSNVAQAKISKNNYDEIEKQLKKVVELSNLNGISKEQLLEMLNKFYSEA
jgi:DNA-binding transcriptional regulator YhcF (GntR family)